MASVPSNNRKARRRDQPCGPGKYLGLRVLSRGRWQGQLIPIKISPFVIGRHPDCHLRPLNPLGHLKECALLFANGSARLRNLAREPGVSINGRALNAEQELGHGDRLEVDSLLFEVVLQEEPIRNPQPAGPQLSIDEETVGALLLAIQDQPRTLSLSHDQEKEVTRVTAVDRAARLAAAGRRQELSDSDEMVWAARALLQRYNNPRLSPARQHRPRPAE
jgi:hypothetical protein